MRSAQSEGKDDIVSLRGANCAVVSGSAGGHGELKPAALKPSGGIRNGNRNQPNTGRFRNN